MSPSASDDSPTSPRDASGGAGPRARATTGARPPAGTPIQATVEPLLRARRLDTAREVLAQRLADQPDDLDALYFLAVTERYAGCPDAALAALGRLHARDPEHGRGHQEAGYVYRQQGDVDAAIGAFGRAIQFNPALAASHQALSRLLGETGRHGEARQVAEKLAWLQSLPPPLVGVMDLLAQGRLAKAETLCRRFLRQAPKHVEGMRLLADIGLRLGVLEDAERLLEHAVAFAPDNARVRMDYVTALRKRQQFARAREEARKLLTLDPTNPQYRSVYAIECMQSGDYAQALEEFDRVLARVPGDPNTLTARGHALKTSGRFDAAVAAYHGALRSRAEHGEAWYSLANLKTYRFGAEELRRMARLEEGTALGAMDRVYLSFALGKAHEDAQNYEQAFRYYARGNRAKRARSRYDADRMHEELAAQQRVCTTEFFAERHGAGCPAPDPIFIVGLPRAGSTLLEQILASHSQVDGTLELPNVLSLSQALRRRALPTPSEPAAGATGAGPADAASRDGPTPGSEQAPPPLDTPGEAIGASADERSRAPLSAAGSYPEILAHLSFDELRAFGEQFLEDTRIHRAGAPFFIDKMPNNFRHIGLIHLMLPNARIIDARRNPMACCFSGFKQLFAEGQEFTYSLEDIGRYYRDYVALMEHWDRVLPGRVLRVHHEHVVADLEGQVRRLLAFCGLPFEQACVEYWKTERNVRTPSSEQVRQPIFREGVAQWRRFQPWLEPLTKALGGEAWIAAHSVA